LRLLAAGLLALMMLGAQAAPGGAPKQQLDALREQLEALEKDIAGAEESRSEATDQLRDSERAISQANRRLRELGTQRAETKATLAGLSEQARGAEAGIERQQEAIGRALHHRYLHGQVEPLRLLLAREDPNQMARDLHYLTYVSRARARVITVLRESLATLAQITEATRTKSDELAAIERSQNNERRTLEREKASRQQVLASVSEQISRQRRELATLKRDEERLTRLVERLAREMARARPPRQKKPSLSTRSVPEPGDGGGAFRQLKGHLRLPVAGELSSRFGSPRDDRGLSSKGIFIRTRAGQEVRAVAAGRVVFADWLRGFGNLLIVDHGDGYMSLYGNNEALFRRAGDSVRGGDAVAAAGATGGNEETGLYFELRFQGRPFDPLSWSILR
jgi:septal ring factor EnvC (AmiA/AmiB activator)